MNRLEFRVEYSFDVESGAVIATPVLNYVSSFGKDFALGWEKRDRSSAGIPRSFAVRWFTYSVADANCWHSVSGGVSSVSDRLLPITPKKALTKLLDQWKMENGKWKI